MEAPLFENAVADLLFHNGYRDAKAVQEAGLGADFCHCDAKYLFFRHN